MGGLPEIEVSASPRNLFLIWLSTCCERSGSSDALGGVGITLRRDLRDRTAPVERADGDFQHPVRPLLWGPANSYLPGLSVLRPPPPVAADSRSLTPAPMLRVRIASLPLGLHEETLRPTAADLDLDPEMFSEIEVDLRLDVGEQRVLARFTASATAHLECDRTLAPFDQHIEGKHAVLFTTEAASEDDEGVVPFPADATDIDLTDPVRDTLVLAVPTRRVSPEAEAAEIPTAFGAPGDDEPADDRWAALQALRDDNSDSTD